MEKDHRQTFWTSAREHSAKNNWPLIALPEIKTFALALRVKFALLSAVLRNSLIQQMSKYRYFRSI